MAEFDEALISAVKDYPCLYNTKSGDYKVTWKKENAWAEIAKRLKTNSKISTLFQYDIYKMYCVVDVVIKR